jgi:hypothetical protein
MCTIIHFQLLRLFKGKMIQRNCKLRKRSTERVFIVCFNGLYMQSLELLEKTSEDKQSPLYGLQNLSYILVEGSLFYAVCR